MSEETTIIPEGYRQDALGRLVPVGQIKPLDLIRDDLVTRLVARASEIRRANADFRTKTLDEIEAFVSLSAAEYGVELGGKKGNLTLTTFDGRYKIQRAIQERITFDERLGTAKALIDKCVTRWAEGSRAELITLVTDAFQVDKTGRISTQRILSLRKLDFADADWKRAMTAIDDAITVASSKTQLRIYERDARGEYQYINLDPNAG